MTQTADLVRRHYARDGIVKKILNAMDAAGKDPDRLTVEDLAPIDQMHLRGIQATRDLARQADVQNGDQVLDVGSGLGGPARTFAAEFGAEVIGIDLTPEFVKAGNELNRRLKLDSRVTFREGDATHMPFEDDSFDVVMSMTAFMNIPDKQAVYNEIRRVLRPGGRLVQLEVMAGPNGEPHFPVLWAKDASYSFLEPPETIRRHLENADFQVVDWNNEDQASLAWAMEMKEQMQQQGPNAIGPHVVHGTEIVERMENALRSLKEGRVTAALLTIETAAENQNKTQGTRTIKQ